MLYGNFYYIIIENFHKKSPRVLIPTIKFGSTYYNTFTMGVCSNYHGYLFQCYYYYETTHEIKRQQTFDETKLNESCRFTFNIYVKIRMDLARPPFSMCPGFL